MGQPFLSEIRIMGFNFAPRGWAFCDGQILPINQNQSLYSLLGTAYGGDGRTSFALPELRGRTPVRNGSVPGTIAAPNLGQKGGSEYAMVTTAQYPSHTHQIFASTADADSGLPANNSISKDDDNSFGAAAALGAMNNETIANSPGGGNAHENRQPYLALHYCIATQGTFPSRS